MDDCEVYEQYLSACARLAATTGVSLRTLDQCLWTIGERDDNRYGLAHHGLSLGQVRPKLLSANAGTLQQE